MSHPDLIPTPTSAEPREIDFGPEGLVIQVAFALMSERHSFAVGSMYRESSHRIRNALGNRDERGAPRPFCAAMRCIDWHDGGYVPGAGSP